MAAIDAEVVAYIRHLAEKWLAADPERNPADLARASGLSGAAISKITNKGEGVGFKAMLGIGGIFGHRTVPEVEAAARDWAAEQPGRARSEPSPRGPRAPPRLRDRVEWSHAAALALLERPELDQQAIDDAGEVYDSEVYSRPLHPRFLANIAYAFYVDRRTPRR